MFRLTREEALRLHREMWSDMQKILGNCPTLRDRSKYKRDWCKKRFPDNFILNNCFLCEYTAQNDLNCIECLIKWNGNTCCDDWEYAPISEILTLPIRKD